MGELGSGCPLGRERQFFFTNTCLLTQCDQCVNACVGEMVAWGPGSWWQCDYNNK